MDFSYTSVESTTADVANLATEKLWPIFDAIDTSRKAMIARLKKFVSFPTMSSDFKDTTALFEMADYLVDVLSRFGFESSLLPLDPMEMADDNFKYPPLILASTEVDPKKNTVCFYCHFDVTQIPTQNSFDELFTLRFDRTQTELHGKGVSEGKGPLLCVINAISAYHKANIPLPVNIKLVLDPLGAANAEITSKYLLTIRPSFFESVDFACICDGHWVDSQPCVINGSRGLCYFFVEIEGSSKPLNSGTYGGALNEPMTDMMYMFNQLVDVNGEIKIKELYEEVLEVSAEELEKFATMKFNVFAFKSQVGVQELLAKENKASLLMKMWRMPSLSIHGFEGVTSESDIPAKVTGKFSINLVPDMLPSKVRRVVFNYLGRVWKSRRSHNKMRAQMSKGKLPWLTEPDDPNVLAAVNAIKCVYDGEPNVIRQSKRARMAVTLQKLTRKPVIMIPVGKANDVTSTNHEKIDVVNYINGAKVFAAYFNELGKIYHRPSSPDSKDCPEYCNFLNECLCDGSADTRPKAQKDRVSMWKTDGMPGEEMDLARLEMYNEQIQDEIGELKRIINESDNTILDKIKKVESVGRKYNGNLFRRVVSLHEPSGKLTYPGK